MKLFPKYVWNQPVSQCVFFFIATATAEVIQEGDDRTFGEIWLNKQHVCFPDPNFILARIARSEILQAAREAALTGLTARQIYDVNRIR